MTEAWKSNANYWCEYCRVWMADNPQVRAIHESGAKHKENVARHLREMRLRSDRDKKEKEKTTKALEDIEKQALKQYEADKAAQEQAETSQYGTWVWHQESGYYYNARQRWYYDAESRMYYGGDPPDWTSKPSIPSQALYSFKENNNRPPEKHVKKTSQITSSAGASIAGASGAGGSAHVQPIRGVLPGQRIGNIAHPLAQIGGRSMPSIGKIGGAKGVGIVDRRNSPDDSSGKRKRADSKPSKQPLSKEEEEFMARREAARRRVQARSMAEFGLG